MEEFNNKEIKVLDKLYKTNFINNLGYDITETLLKEYVKVYGDIFSKGNRKLDVSNYRFARKVAGLTLIKHNLFLGNNINDIKSGLVYIIENESFPDHFKLGMTVDLNKRLASFQTYDPYRRFKISNYDFHIDRRKTEYILLNDYSIKDENGEWIDKKYKQEIMDRLLTDMR